MKYDRYWLLFSFMFTASIIPVYVYKTSLLCWQRTLYTLLLFYQQVPSTYIGELKCYFRYIGATFNTSDVAFITSVLVVCLIILCITVYFCATSSSMCEVRTVSIIIPTPTHPPKGINSWLDKCYFFSIF